MIALFALLTLTGCDSSKTITDVKNLYTQMSENSNESAYNDLFTDGQFDIKYEIEYLNDSESELLAGSLSDGLKISYIQINSLYNNVLKLSNALYQNFSDYVYDSAETFKFDKNKVTLLYNKLVDLNKEVTLFEEAKGNLEDIASNPDSATSNTFENRLKKFNYSFGSLVKANIEFVESFEDVFLSVYTAGSDILDKDNSEVDKQFYINSLICEGYLRYAKLMFREVIAPNMQNNACDTKSLQYIEGSTLKTYLGYVTGANDWSNNISMMFEGNEPALFDSTTPSTSECELAKRLYSANTLFDKYYVFYDRSINSIDYAELKEYRLKSIVEENSEVYTEYVSGFDTVSTANLEVANDFLNSQVAGLYQTLVAIA